LATKKIIEFFHRKGVAVSIWTINDAKLARKFLGFRVEALITDRPDIIRRVVDE
jgi:glycerophosphoryl diester phosphodiesterase